MSDDMRENDDMPMPAHEEEDRWRMAQLRCQHGWSRAKCERCNGTDAPAPDRNAKVEAVVAAARELVKYTVVPYGENHYACALCDIVAKNGDTCLDGCSVARLRVALAVLDGGK